MKDSAIVDIISRKLAPFVLLFGFYLISHGHLSPGGGFQGGVVLASGVILLSLSRGADMAQGLFPRRPLTMVVMVAFLLILTMGFAGLLMGKHFLGDFLHTGKAGEMHSAGFIFVLDLLIGIKVGAGMSLICLYLLRED